MHWSEKIAKDIIKRSPDKEEYVCAAGISPSGSIHIGNFRDIATSYFVYKALVKQGKKARLLFSWDEFDRFRKVPVNVKEIAPELENDIGKPYVCREVDGVRHFKGHAHKGAELTDRILTRLRFDNNTRKQVTELILHHDDNWHPSRKMIRRTISAIGKEQTGRLMLIHYCDILAQNPACIEDSLKDLAVIKDYYDRILEEENCFTLADLAVSGSDLIALGMKPGPDIGETLQKMLELVLNEECENDREQLLAHRGRFSVSIF